MEEELLKGNTMTENKEISLSFPKNTEIERN
jgi:hypothetical protein